MQCKLAMSRVQGEWFVQRCHVEQMYTAYHNGWKIMFFFMVKDSDHIQEAALIISMALYQDLGGGTADAGREYLDLFCY
eukprot:11890687-Ditylum_brightwellii.AAC.1